MRSRVWPASRSASVSPTQTMASRPARQAAAALARDLGVGLAVVGAALGVADDDGDGAGVGEHLGGDVAGVGARGLRVAVLAADREGAAGEAGEQRAGRADQHVAGGRGLASASSTSTAAEAARPFIFQFPATSLRRACAPSSC